MSPVQVGIIGCLALFVLLASSMPVAFVMMIIGGLGFALIINPHAALSMISADIFNTFSSYSLTVIPLFVLMGQVAFHTGISKRLFRTAYTWFGQLPGGLAMATVGACTGFGAICGSGPATAATMASVAIPEMRRYHYSMELASGSVAAGGSLGMLIPPSVVFIVYAIMTEQSIGELFLAGILPGLLIALLFCLTIFLLSIKNKNYGPAGKKTSIREKLISLNGVIETLILFVFIIGGMFLGFFTPTEAAAVGAAGSIVIALIKRQLSFKMLKQAVKETIRTSCMVMLIVCGAVIFGHFLAVTRIPMHIADFLTALPLPGPIIIFFIILFYLFCGCFIDALALILLTIPIFYPVISELGFNSIWFGVIIVIVTQMGVISPPVGVNVYVINGIERDIPLGTIFKGAVPFLFALIAAAVILIAFPQISLFLPSLLH